MIQAWYPGQAGGTAIADVLFGDYNPAGKLPVTFYRNTEQLPDLRRLCNERTHLPLHDRNAALPLRTRTELHHLRLRQSPAKPKRFQQGRNLDPHHSVSTLEPVTEKKRCKYISSVRAMPMPLRIHSAHSSGSMCPKEEPKKSSSPCPMTISYGLTLLPTT